MSRDDRFVVRNRTVPAIGEANPERGIITPGGAQVFVDWLTHLLLSGRCYHMQTGTEDAPSTTNGPLDDTKPVLLADNNEGTIVPILAEVSIAAHGAATAIEAMLEADMDKKRYSSGGTVVVPEAMNNQSSNAANGTFYTIEGSDIVALAKSAVPASVELGRKTFSENVIADPAGAQMAIDKLFSARERLPVLAKNPSALLLHFGSATADVTGYATLDFAQFPSALAW